ncbi:MAG: cytochrome P450 [Bacteroidota bacterium]
MSKTHSADSPPIVPGLPLVGSAFRIFGADPRDFLMSQYRRLGPVFRLKAFHIDYLIMAGPAANRFVNAQGRHFFQSGRFWKGMLKEIEAENFLIGLDGEDHRKLRKKFNFNFSKLAVEPHIEEINELCVETFRKMDPGVAFEVVNPVLQLSSKMIGCVMTGKVPDNKELEEFLYYLNETTNHFSLNRFPAWLLKFKGPRFRKARALTMAFAEGVINEKIEGRRSIHNYVDTVFEAAQECPHLFAHGDLRFSAILPFFAGIDTMGQTLNYALFELHRHPDLLSRVKKEVNAVFSYGIPDLKQIKEMELVTSTVLETMRLHPSAFGMVRTAVKSFNFEGFDISKGTDIVILTSAPHFNEAYFKNPSAFDIDRFRAPRNEHLKRDVFAPFGRGPHTCLGAGMSMTLMVLALGAILFNYEFETLSQTKKYKERISPTPSLGKHFKLVLKRRRQLR